MDIYVLIAGLGGAVIGFILGVLMMHGKLTHGGVYDGSVFVIQQEENAPKELYLQLEKPIDEFLKRREAYFYVYKDPIIPRREHAS